jgi:GNAT superfamily N-acetyltransferase
MKQPSDLVFALINASGHGKDTLRAVRDGRVVGELKFNLTIGVSLGLWIHWLEVAPGERRQGIASALLAEAKRRYPWAVVDTGGLTAEGALFEAGKH